jgi:phage-Barnase-EndoU-ColicinE5/D-RelE like nuclease2/Phage Mu protein F like protein
MADTDLIVPFKEASDYFRQKVQLPSKDWRDLEGRAHDRAFVIAGAMEDALLTDLRGALQKAIDEGTTLEQFRKDFDQIVHKQGWSGWTGEGTERGRAWRTRVIFETNLRTAYAAGRYAQMTDPDVTKVYKYWRYQHGYYRSPRAPRLKHKCWDGIVLPWNDPWWDSHYPPNDWGCSCGVEVLSARDLKNDGLNVSAAPDTLKRRVLDPKTGSEIMVPDGIGLGWDHAPGKDWSQGLVPVELQEPLSPLKADQLTGAAIDAAMPDARPFKQKLLPDDISPEAAAEAFLSVFGATMETPVLFRDAAGHAIPISKSLLTKKGKSLKTNKRGRGPFMAQIAEALLDPDEIWVDWFRRDTNNQPILMRKYIRVGKASGDLRDGFAIFEWSADGWFGKSAFAPSDDPEYVERQRTGAMIWRRTAK